MPLSVYWANEEEDILVYKMVEPWTLEELYLIIDEGYKLSYQKPSPLFLIYDFRENIRFPGGFFRSLSYMQKRYQDNVMLRVVVGGNTFFHNVYSVVRHLHPPLSRTIVMADTLEEAIERIEEVRKYDV